MTHQCGRRALTLRVGEPHRSPIRSVHHDVRGVITAPFIGDFVIDRVEQDEREMEDEGAPPPPEPIPSPPQEPSEPQQPTDDQPA